VPYNGQVAAQPALISSSEYLRREAEAVVRHEFVAGTVYAMAGASRNHAMITRNLHGMLYGLLGRGPCQNLDQNTKVWISGSNAFYYADATIACPPSFIDERSGVIDNPTVVF
jgi:Uma2 family endonuclease